MPFKFNSKGRHHIPRQRHRVTNWRDYDAALRNRGSLTIWFTDPSGSAAGASSSRTSAGSNRTMAEHNPRRRFLIIFGGLPAALVFNRSCPIMPAYCTYDHRGLVRFAALSGNSYFDWTSATNGALLRVRRRLARPISHASSSTLPAVGHWRGRVGDSGCCRWHRRKTCRTLPTVN